MVKIKTAGIICDNYKLNKYKSTLEERGFKNYNVSRYTKNTSVIKVKINMEEMYVVSKICQELELYFKAIKN